MIAALIECAGRLPLELRISLGRCLGFIFSLIPTRDRKICELQLERFAKAMGGRALTSSVYQSVGQTLMESINLAPILKRLDTRVACPDWEQLAPKVSSRKSGILALSAHTGNWELLAAYFAAKGHKLTVIGRQARNLRFQEILAKLRARNGLKTVWRNDASGTKEIIRALKSKGIVAALSDQDTYVASKFVPFFGAPARTPSAMVDLAKKLECMIVAAFIFRTTRNSYEIRLHDIPAELPPEEILRTYNSLLEEYIRKFPDQWVWFHKRWRSLSEEQRLSSREYVRYLQGLQSGT
ncbi:MAG: hypothetical protein DCC75_06615 [Proteobacteria bacterium]|nr:MAG: hypothetical protein DCC75_06615 [Pseudomonadota bacterium]